MSGQLTSMDVAEVAGRLRQFKGMSPEHRTLHLGFIAPSRCNDERANQLFDSFCKGGVDRDGEDAFFDHICQCSRCHSAFLRLVWLSTDFDGH